MSFLIPSDFNTQTRKAVRDLLKTDDPNALDKAALIAISEISSYLNHRVDTVALFPDITLYDAAENYTVDQPVYYKVDGEDDSTYEVYTCTAAGTGNLPTDTDYFIKRDPRNHLIIMYCIDILIYHLYSGRSLRNLPQLRTDRYESAIEWLEEAGKGKNINGLPAKAESEIITEFRYGSNPKEDHRW